MISFVITMGVPNVASMPSMTTTATQNGMGFLSGGVRRRSVAPVAVYCTTAFKQTHLEGTPNPSARIHASSRLSRLAM